MDVTEAVRAAGGVVTRRSGEGELEVVIVHRASYGDWTFPKGKLDDGEGEEYAHAGEVGARVRHGLSTRLRRRRLVHGTLSSASSLPQADIIARQHDTTMPI